MTRLEQIEAAIIQVLTPGPCQFADLLLAVQRAFPDASATEVDQAARQWERGEVGRYVYSLDELPQTQPCDCGYQDRDFCPRHGEAMREVAAANRYAKAPTGEGQLSLFAAPTEAP